MHTIITMLVLCVKWQCVVVNMQNIAIPMNVEWSKVLVYFKSQSTEQATQHNHCLASVMLACTSYSDYHMKSTCLCVIKLNPMKEHHFILVMHAVLC